MQKMFFWSFVLSSIIVLDTFALHREGRIWPYATGKTSVDMQNFQLAELNIQIGNTELIFVSVPQFEGWQNQTLISDLSFIPKGTTDFMIEIYGYGASISFQTLTDLQAAIKNNTLKGFAAQVYDANNQPIGNSIPLNADLVASLKSSLSSSNFTSVLGVNDNPVSGITFTYPISLTLTNVSGLKETTLADLINTF